MTYCNRSKNQRRTTSWATCSAYHRAILTGFNSFQCAHSWTVVHLIISLHWACFCASLVPKYSQKQHLKFSWRGLRDWYTQRQWQWSPTNPVIQNPCFSKTPIKWAGALSLVFAYPYYLKSRNGVGEVRNRNKLSSFWHSKKKLQDRYHVYIEKLILTH